MVKQLKYTNQKNFFFVPSSFLVCDISNICCVEKLPCHVSGVLATTTKLNVLEESHFNYIIMPVEPPFPYWFSLLIASAGFQFSRSHIYMYICICLYCFVVASGLLFD